MMNMLTAKSGRKYFYLLAMVLFAGLPGCGSSSGGGSSSATYYSVTHYDPWYYGGGYYDDVDVYVPGYPESNPDDRPQRPERPQRGEGIKRPSQPIARPGLRPETRPSLPSRARPMGYSRPSGLSRGMGMRGGRRR